MAITFTTAKLPGGLSATGLYAHIHQVSGPHKIDAISDPVTAESWFITYGVIVHKDAAARAADNSAWANRVPMDFIDTFKITGLANLDTYPTMAILYSDLKTKLAAGDSPIASSIADA